MACAACRCAWGETWTVSSRKPTSSSCFEGIQPCVSPGRLRPHLYSAFRWQAILTIFCGGILLRAPGFWDACTVGNFAALPPEFIFAFFCIERPVALRVRVTSRSISHLNTRCKYGPAHHLHPSLFYTIGAQSLFPNSSPVYVLQAMTTHVLPRFCPFANHNPSCAPLLLAAPVVSHCPSLAPSRDTPPLPIPPSTYLYRHITNRSPLSTALHPCI